MAGFRLLLTAAWLILATYTAIVLNLLPIFFGDMGELGWPGQFNLDFLCFLILSALWTAWRHAFSFAGMLLAVVALVGGAGFLLPYLLIQSVRAKGDMRVVLLGPTQA
jgi:hypothetical protein